MADWMKKAVKRPGAFKAKAKSHGMSVAAYADSVLKGKSKASTRTKAPGESGQNLRKIPT